jgi:NADPH:quinone reductase-like Zn-dependent oxidoreductase
MKALVAAGYGPVEDATITDVPKPALEPGKLLVRVEAAGINPIDVKLVTGAVREMMPVEHPLIVGVDASGVVEAVGEGVSGYAPGDAIVGIAFPGGTIADYTLMPPGPVARRPADLSAPRAAALPNALLTAAAIAESMQPRARQLVLGVGTAGAVGSFLLQLLADTGVRVISTARPEDADRVRGLGAAEVIDYTSLDTITEALRRYPDGFDVAVDLVNFGAGIATTASAVKPGGKVFSALGGPPEFDRGVTAAYLNAYQALGQFQELVERVAVGKLAVEISGYPFAQAPRALADFAVKRTRKRVVVTM